MSKCKQSVAEKGQLNCDIDRKRLLSPCGNKIPNLKSSPLPKSFVFYCLCPQIDAPEQPFLLLNDPLN